MYSYIDYFIKCVIRNVVRFFFKHIKYIFLIAVIAFIIFCVRYQIGGLFL